MRLNLNTILGCTGVANISKYSSKRFVPYQLYFPSMESI